MNLDDGQTVASVAPDPGQRRRLSARRPRAALIRRLPRQRRGDGMYGRRRARPDRGCSRRRWRGDDGPGGAAGRGAGGDRRRAGHRRWARSPATSATPAGPGRRPMPRRSPASMAGGRRRPRLAAANGGVLVAWRGDGDDVVVTVRVGRATSRRPGRRAAGMADDRRCVPPSGEGPCVHLAVVTPSKRAGDTVDQDVDQGQRDANGNGHAATPAATTARSTGRRLGRWQPARRRRSVVSPASTPTPERGRARPVARRRARSPSGR